MSHVYQEVEKKHGKKIDLAHKSTFNPKTKKYFAFSDAYSPDPGNWHKDWWAEAGYPNGFDAGDLYPWPPYTTMGEAVGGYLGAIGIKVRLRTMERAAFYSALAETLP